LAALTVLQQPRIPVRRRHLALYAVSEVSFLAVVLVVFFVVIPTSNWPGTVLGLIAGALAIPPLLLKNLVPVVPTVVKRISLMGTLLTIPVAFVAFSIDGLSRPAQLLMTLVPSILAGVALVLVGARRA
jgi:hypothetical protein